MPELEPELHEEPRAATDLDIQQWVFKRHGFVPHPAWITHCREIYLGAPHTDGGECPPDKRTAIREAFVALELLKEWAPLRQRVERSCAKRCFLRKRSLA